MKKIYLSSLCFCLLIFSNNAHAQLFGQDVKINPGALEAQNEVQIDVAFNGWIFALYNTQDSTGGGLTLRKSIDNGATWTTVDHYSVVDVDYKQFDMVVAGTDTNSLKVFVAGVYHSTTAADYRLFVDRYDGKTGNFLGSMLVNDYGTRAIYDVALATDYTFPAVGVSPYSVGLIYSCYSSTYDSINFYCSTDGGNSFLPSKNIFTTGSYCRNVSIDYTRSQSGSNGRYVFAWEQLSSGSARTGHIYTARNLATVDGTFSTPVNLDSVSSTMINLCRNPKIAAQHNNLDNDSGSTTAIVMVDRDYIGDGSDYDLLGFYNKRAHYGDFWNRLDVVNSGEDDMQSDISYDPTNNNFLLTYLDSSNLKMPYVINGYNLATPSTWVTISTNYVNHNQVLGNAFPKVVINPAVTQVALAWVKNENGKNTAYFDAEYSTVQAFNVLLNDSVCTGDSVLFNGVYYKAAVSGISDTAEAFNGVDSIVTFSLVIDTLPLPTIGVAGNVLSTGLYNAYQWQLNNGDISAATAQSYTAPVSGLYSVLVTDGNGCKGKSAQLNLSVLSVNESADDLGVKVYPNPMTDNLYFDLGSLNGATILLTDLQGKVVNNQRVVNHEAVDVSNLPAGVYLLKVNSDKHSMSLKIEKQ